MIDLFIIEFKILLLLVFAIGLHELGHIFYFKWKTKKNVEIKFEDMSFTIGDYEKDYVGLSLDEKKDLFWAGIIFGLFPIFIACLYNWLYLFTFAFYLIGCKSDLINLKRLYKE